MAHSKESDSALAAPALLESDFTPTTHCLELYLAPWPTATDQIWFPGPHGKESDLAPIFHCLKPKSDYLFLQMNQNQILWRRKVARKHWAEYWASLKRTAVCHPHRMILKNPFWTESEKRPGDYRREVTPCMPDSVSFYCTHTFGAILWRRHVFFSSHIFKYFLIVHKM